MSMRTIHEGLKATERRKRRQFLTIRLESLGVQKDLADLKLPELEDMYIKAMNDKAKAYGENE